MALAYSELDILELLGSTIIYTLNAYETGIIFFNETQKIYRIHREKIAIQFLQGLIGLINSAMRVKRGHMQKLPHTASRYLYKS